MTYKDEHDIEAILKKLQSATMADPGAILRAKNIVMAEVRATKYEFDTNIQKVSWFMLMRRVKFAPALAVVLIILLGGGGVAAAAQGAMPGDALYGVKIVTERVVVKLAPTPRAKVRVETKLAERRAHELEVLKERAVQAPPEIKLRLEENIERTSASMTDHLENAQARIEELQTRGVPIPGHVIERLEMLESRQETREEMHNSLPQNVGPGLVPGRGGAQGPALHGDDRGVTDNATPEIIKELEFPPQAATIPIPDDETRQFVENAEELLIGLRTQKAELKQKGIDIDGGVDSALQELQTLITKARALWNDKQFNDVRALEPQIQELLVRIATLLNVENSAQPEASE